MRPVRFRHPVCLTNTIAECNTDKDSNISAMKSDVEGVHLATIESCSEKDRIFSTFLKTSLKEE